MFDKEKIKEKRTLLENLSRMPDISSKYLRDKLEEFGLIYTCFGLPSSEYVHDLQNVYVVGLHCGTDHSRGPKPGLRPLNFWDSIFLFVFDNDDRLQRFEEQETLLEKINQLLAIGTYWGGFDGKREYFSML